MSECCSNDDAIICSDSSDEETETSFKSLSSSDEKAASLVSFNGATEKLLDSLDRELDTINFRTNSMYYGNPTTSAAAFDDEDEEDKKAAEQMDDDTNDEAAAYQDDKTPFYIFDQSQQQPLRKLTQSEMSRYLQHATPRMPRSTARTSQSPQRMAPTLKQSALPSPAYRRASPRRQFTSKRAPLRTRSSQGKGVGSRPAARETSDDNCSVVTEDYEKQFHTLMVKQLAGLPYQRAAAASQGAEFDSDIDTVRSAIVTETVQNAVNDAHSRLRRDEYNSESDEVDHCGAAPHLEAPPPPPLSPNRLQAVEATALRVKQAAINAEKFLSNDIRQLQQEKVRIQYDIERFHEQLSEIVGEIQKRNAELQAKNENEELINREVAEITNKKQQALTELSQISNEIEAKTREVSDLVSKKEEMNKQLSDLSDMGYSKDKVLQLMREREQLLTQIHQQDDHQAMLDAKDRVIREVEEREKQLNTELDRFRRSLEETALEKQQFSEQALKMREKLNKVEEERDRLIEEITTRRTPTPPPPPPVTRVAVCQTNNEEDTRKADQKTVEQLGLIQTRLEQIERSNASALTDKEKECLRLRSELREREASFQRKIEELKEQLNSDTDRDEVVKMKAELITERRESDQMREKLMITQRALEVEREQRRIDCDELRNQLMKVREERNVEIEMLKRCMGEDMRAELSRLESYADQMKEDNARLTAELQTDRDLYRECILTFEKLELATLNQIGDEARRLSSIANTNVRKIRQNRSNGFAVNESILQLHSILSSTTIPAAIESLKQVVGDVKDVHAKSIEEIEAMKAKCEKTQQLKEREIEVVRTEAEQTKQIELDRLKKALKREQTREADVNRSQYEQQLSEEISRKETEISDLHAAMNKWKTDTITKLTSKLQKKFADELEKQARESSKIRRDLERKLVSVNREMDRLSREVDFYRRLQNEVYQQQPHSRASLGAAPRSSDLPPSTSESNNLLKHGYRSKSFAQLSDSGRGNSFHGSDERFHLVMPLERLERPPKCSPELQKSISNLQEAKRQLDHFYDH